MHHYVCILTVYLSLPVTGRKERKEDLTRKAPQVNKGKDEDGGNKKHLDRS